MKSFKFYLIIVIIALSSCEKEEPPVEDCPTYIEGWDNIFQSTFIYRQYDFRAPVFNPNNPDEFIYIRYPVGAIYDYELRKHKISTGEDNWIANINYCGKKISWAISDWLIFNQTLYDVWKIKGDGSGLVKLTNGGINMNPLWNTDGSQFVYTSNDLTILADYSGTSIDTLPVSGVFGWSGSGLSYISNYMGEPTFGIFNLTTQSSTQYPLVDAWALEDAILLPDGVSMLASYNKNIWRINIATGEVIVIKNKCGDKYSYNSLTLSSNNKILVERTEALMVDSFTYKINNDIVLMNIDGSNEQVIELPQ